MTRTQLMVTGLVFIVVVFGLYLLLRPEAAPWEASGRLVIVTRPVPGPTAELSVGVGLDDMKLHREDGEVLAASILNRRITLTPGDSDLQVLLDADMPVGEYSGFSFLMKSPSVSNPWQEEEAPESVSMPGEFIRLASPYTITEGQTTAIILGFETIQAMHQKDDEQIYLPVVQIETRDGVDATISEKTAIIEGGEIAGSSTFGMTWEGVMRYNYRERPAPPQAEEPVAIEEIIPESEPEVETTNAATTSDDVATSSDERVEP